LLGFLWVGTEGYVRPTRSPEAENPTRGQRPWFDDHASVSIALVFVCCPSGQGEAAYFVLALKGISPCQAALSVSSLLRYAADTGVAEAVKNML